MHSPQICDVLCAITLPEHRGLRLSTAVNGCHVVRPQTKGLQAFRVTRDRLRQYLAGKTKTAAQ